MPLFSTITSKRNMRFLGTRLLLGLAAVLIYLFILRPVRVTITEHIIYPQVKFLETERGEGQFSSALETGALVVQYKYNDSSKHLQYRPEFGFFFLIACVALLFVSSHKRPYVLLATLHLAGSFLVYLFLMMGAAGIQTGFILTDAISGYMVPALSLGLVPLVIRGDVES